MLYFCSSWDEQSRDLPYHVDIKRDVYLTYMKIEFSLMASMFLKVYLS